MHCNLGFFFLSENTQKLCPYVHVHIHVRVDWTEKRSNTFLSACMFLFVWVSCLTPGQPPLLGLQGQRAHHSPHVCCCRRGNKFVWILKSVSLCHVLRRLERAHTLPRPLPSSHPLLPPLNGCSRQKPSHRLPSFHALSLSHSAPPSFLSFHIFLPTLLQSHPPSPFFVFTLPPFFPVSGSLYIHHSPSTSAESPELKQGISDSVCNRQHVDSQNYKLKWMYHWYDKTMWITVNKSNKHALFHFLSWSHSSPSDGESKYAQRCRLEYRLEK